MDHERRADRHLALAAAYAEAARRVLAEQLIEIERLPYLALVAHGLELALKAILIRAGRNEEDLISIGHDLARARDAVERCYPAIAASGVADLAMIVEALSQPHAGQYFRYPQFLSPGLPEPKEALDCLRRVIEIAVGSKVL